MKDRVDKLLDDAIEGRSLFKNRKILHSSYTPTNILHRDEEQKKVMQSLSPLAKKSQPSNLLIYGKPGTGKTLVIKDTLKRIQDHPKLKSHPIKIIITNAKEEATPTGLLVSLGRALGLESEEQLPSTGLSTGSVFKKIIDVVKSNSLRTIFVIDEIDHLAKTKYIEDKDVLYQMTRANTRTGTGFISIIGISNTLDFKEKLDPRVVSSLNAEEIVFNPYTVEQIKEILEDRKKDAFAKGVVAPSAINLCSARAGQEHGDARRAIDLLRVAGELAEREGSSNVTDDHIRRAADKMEEDKDTALLKSLPLHEKLIILAVVKANGNTTVEIYQAYKNLCKTIRQKELTLRRATQMLNEVEITALVTGKIINQGIHGRSKKYNTSIPIERIKKAFKDDLVLEDII
jgi:cell division control protein 6